MTLELCGGSLLELSGELAQGFLQRLQLVLRGRKLIVGLLQSDAFRFDFAEDSVESHDVDDPRTQTRSGFGQDLNLQFKFERLVIKIGKCRLVRGKPFLGFI